jgi:hypothetical protein
MGLKLKTASNGSVSLEPTNTASDYTLTVPAQTGTVLATNSSGNVGINTTTPAVRLNGKTLSINNTDSGQNYQSGIELLNNGASAGEIWANDVEMVVNAYYNKDLNFRTNNTFRMKIDSSGRVTTPYQPAFSVYKTTTTSGSTTYVYDAVDVNIGSHYNTSNGRFTAPVAGKYFISAYCCPQSVDTWGACAIYLNGSIYKGMYVRRFLSNGGEWCTNTTILNLNAGDYIFIQNTENTVLSGRDNNGFCGYLIG